MRVDVDEQEAAFGRLTFDVDAEGNQLELDFEGVKRVKRGEEYYWNRLVEGSKKISGEENKTRSQQERCQAYDK